MRKLVFSALILATAAGGCASWYLKGGRLVKAGYQPETLIDYRAEGTVPNGVSYHLVRWDGQDVFFERSADGSGSLITHHWKDKDGDHYACWVPNRSAWVYDVPTDRSQPAKRSVFPAGMYTLTEIPDVGLWPFATTTIEPTATLYPK